MKWNQRLTQAREAKNLSKSALARLLKISAPTMTHWESGEIESIKGENLMKLCRTLEITEDWLMNGQPPMRPGPATLPHSMQVRCETADELRLLTAYRLADEVARRTFDVVVDGVLSTSADAERRKA